MRSLFVMAILAIASPALADDWSDEGRARPIDRWNAWEGAAAIQIGDLPFGTYDGGGIGALVDGGRRWNKLYVFGEYGFVSEDGKVAGSTDATRGYLQRVSANARYDLLRDSLASTVTVELTAQVGVGEEYLRWARGGSIRRGDVSFGFSADTRIRHGAHYFGFSVGLDFLLARSPVVAGSSPSCGGPCYEPSSPLETDLGVLYVIAFPFGA